MKRSNRLILLIGLFLAVVAFVLIVVFLGGGQTTPGDTGPREVGQVYSRTAIPLGTLVTATNVNTIFETRTVRTPEALKDVLTDTALTIGQTVRQDVVAGQPITNQVFGGTTFNIKVPPGMRGVAIQVDQVTGAGTLIKAGDYVDVVVGFPGDVFPVIQIDPETDLVTPVAGLNGTSVKLLIQQLQVIGILLPPPPTDAQGEPVEGDPTLTGQQEIVIVAVDEQQSEIIKFAQMQGNISLALRAIEDFQEDIKPLPDVTTGIILKTLVDEYGVLPPELIETTVGQ